VVPSSTPSHRLAKRVAMDHVAMVTVRDGSIT
jgi:hypothetical protein